MDALTDSDWNSVRRVVDERVRPFFTGFPYLNALDNRREVLYSNRFGIYSCDETHCHPC
jgi:hypothetical protein